MLSIFPILWNRRALVNEYLAARAPLALQALAHEFLALVAFQALRTRLLVARRHLLLLRIGLRAAALETGAHECLSLIVIVELLLLRIGVALLHALLLRG